MSDVVERLYQVSLAREDRAYQTLYKKLTGIERSKLVRMSKAMDWAFRHGKQVRLEAGLYFDDYFTLSDRGLVNKAYSLIYGDKKNG